MNNYCCYTLGARLESCSCDEFHEDEIKQIESDLSVLCEKFELPLSLPTTRKALNPDVDYRNADHLRRTFQFFGHNTPFPFMEHPFIDSMLYSRYRRWHDLVHHVFGHLEFSWEGERASWEMADCTLQALGCHQATLEFVRDDILYRNAQYHYHKGKPPNRPLAVRLSVLDE